MNPLNHWSLTRWPFTDSAAVDYPFAGLAYRRALAELSRWLDGGSPAAWLIAEPGHGTSTLLRRWASRAGHGRHAIEPVLTQGPVSSVPLAWSRLAAAWRLDPTSASARSEFAQTLNELDRLGITPVWLVDGCDHATAQLADELLAQHAPLRVVLASPSGLAQTIETTFRHAVHEIDLARLSVEETAAYLALEVQAAGGRNELFDSSAISRLWEATDGRIAALAQLARQSLITAAEAGARIVNRLAVEIALDNLDAAAASATTATATTNGAARAA